MQESGENDPDGMARGALSIPAAETSAPRLGALCLGALRTHLNRWSLENLVGFLGRGQKGEAPQLSCQG